MKFKFHCPPLSFAARAEKRLRSPLRSWILLPLIVLFFLPVRAASQSVTISRHNATLATIFSDIKKQTGFTFFYKGNINPASLKTDVELKNASLDAALQACLKKFNLGYTIVSKTIVITTGNGADHGAPANSSTVKDSLVYGKVVDSLTKEAVIAVSVFVKNAAARALTNEKGQFSISADPGDVLILTSVGYSTKEVPVHAIRNQTIVLSPKASSLNDVVVTGYQVIKKDNYTGNAIVVKGEDLKRLNPQNMLKGLASFDPSFRIADNNLFGSDPNAMPKINIRGTTAMPNGEILDRNNLSSSYNLPVFIMDGFEVPLQKVVDLDINRIASVTILKDAAATAVYGSRAANGVIVITTKAPQPGRLRLSYNAEMKATAPDLSDYSVLNATDKLEYERRAGLYSSKNNTANTQDELDQQYYSKLKNVVSGVNSYWLSQPLRNAYSQKHSVYVEGGDSSFRYGVDLRYQTDPGVMKNSGRNRYSGGMSFTYNPNRRLVLKNDLTVTQVNARNSNYGDFSTYVAMNPYYPIYGDDGKLIREIANWRVDTHQPGSSQYKNVPVLNPLYEASLGNFDKSDYLELIDAFSADWRITPALRVIGLMSLNSTKTTTDKFVSPFSNAFYLDPPEQAMNKGSYDYTATRSLNLDGNIRMVYNKLIGQHSVNAVLGANITSATSDFKGFQARGFSNDKFSSIAFARTYTPNAAPSGNVDERRLIGSFFSGSYSYQNKYLFDAAVRLDGSSAFGANKRFAPFWSGGIGWNVHNEDWFKASLPFLSKLKLTGTAGVTGSVDFPPFLARTTYSYQTSNWYSTGIGAIVNGYGNDNLQWQKTTNYEARAEIGLLQDRIILTPVYYYKLTKGLLTDINIAPSTGFSTYKENLGDMANKGYELYVTINALRKENLNINITGNLAHNTNTIVKISNALKAYNESVNNYQMDPNKGAQGKPLLRFAEGQSYNTIYGVKSHGIDPQNGREIYEKPDGSLTYDYDVAYTRPIGDYTPKAEGFFGSNITWKRWMMSFSFHYRFGGDMYNQTLVDRIENADPRFNVDSRALTMRWQQPGDQALYKNITDLNLTYASSRFVQKENLLELQSLYFSYDLAQGMAKSIGLQSLRGAVTMNDILHISSVRQERGIDYPFARSLTCSILATF
ncbi:SusC/RagA family TonB-linked outer membrane protein [Chitinophaga polysaccharea]|uniref:SusC/RagA family TonB-linked outer membrane protein n=1 Tax=Chitinophaga polysaccharea TaxID=1293035 RepID=UPI001455918C|nr:SusC/RagA family TonB-linked outer membrane protein [Chitinophaga polysaccharea]NLR62541.1 SusC/RagA family TonB-linked outer membrane protein [Chitinophaga polysaccharea]